MPPCICIQKTSCDSRLMQIKTSAWNSSTAGGAAGGQSLLRPEDVASVQPYTMVVVLPTQADVDPGCSP
jgi:hypothetical protein